jgi:FtsH-binding integral membrane protein
MAFLKQAALMGDRRIEIVMALSFYLDFINIFLTLLRLFGERNE